MRIRSDLPDIAIMVSRRIDVNSLVIENPLYYPMRCGAVYDDNSNSSIPGDDTGDNVSYKRENYCELTVQYWAWKNLNVDYYGLCHYRRYFSFANKKYPTNEHGLVPRPVLNERELLRFRLLDAEYMVEEISKYDMIVPQAADVKKMPLPQGTAGTVRDLWEAHDGIFFEKSIIDLMFECIYSLTPQYAQSAEEYFSGSMNRGYNCYIMHRSLFEQLCIFQFLIMDALEDRLKSTPLIGDKKRTVAYIGEMLFGIFTYHIIKTEHWNVCEKQLVYFDSTELMQSRLQIAYHILRFWMDQIVRVAAKPLFPLGSRRRELGKQLYFKLTRNK